MWNVRIKVTKKFKHSSEHILIFRTYVLRNLFIKIQYFYQWIIKDVIIPNLLHLNHLKIIKIEKSSKELNKQMCIIRAVIMAAVWLNKWIVDLENNESKALN